MAATRTQKEIRQRAPIWLVMLLFANFVVMAVDANQRFAQQQTFKGLVQAVFSPIQNATSWVSSTGGGFINEILNFRSTARENQSLKERLAQTELELRNTQEAKTENYRLQGLLALKAEPGPEKVFARVIARDASVWFNTIMINRGSSSGVTLNMPVITPGGIVGRVVAVSPVTAQRRRSNRRTTGCLRCTGFGAGPGKFRFGGNALRLRIAESSCWRLRPDNWSRRDLSGGLERRRSHRSQEWHRNSTSSDLHPPERALGSAD